MYSDINEIKSKKRESGKKKKRRESVRMLQTQKEYRKKVMWRWEKWIPARHCGPITKVGTEEKKSISENLDIAFIDASWVEIVNSVKV